MFRAMQHFVSHEAVNIPIQEYFDSKPENFYKDGIMKLLCKCSDIVDNNDAHVFNYSAIH